MTSTTLLKLRQEVIINLFFLLTATIPMIEHGNDEGLFSFQPFFAIFFPTQNDFDNVFDAVGPLLMRDTTVGADDTSQESNPIGEVKITSTVGFYY